jgi:hypothetical protein
MKICLFCSSDISHRNAKAKYCSDSCRTKYSNQEYSQMMKNKIKSRPCDMCTKEFLPAALHSKYRFCSSSCKDKFGKIKAKASGRDKTWKIDPVKLKASQQRSYQNRKEYYFMKNAERRALLAKVTWEKELTDLVYKEAQKLRLLRNEKTNLEWHVDHIIPLRGDTVSGLHVWNNFAVIPKLENLKKGNRHAVHEES